MTKSTCRILLLATALLIVNQADVEAQSRLVGTVSDANGQVVTNANVQLLDTRLGSITDAERALRAHPRCRRHLQRPGDAFGL